MMQVIPAIDLRGGCCVRLRQGDFDQETVFGDDPAAMALRWESEGAERIHLVDLDGAKAGRPVNVEAVKQIVAESACRASSAAGCVIKRPSPRGSRPGWIVWSSARRPFATLTGSLAWPSFFRALAPRAGRAGRKGRDRGWIDVSSIQALTFARQFESLPLAAIIYTDIARDGMLEGPNSGIDRRSGRDR